MEPKQHIDIWTGAFEERKRELIRAGLSPEKADTQACDEIRAQIRRTPMKLT